MRARCRHCLRLECVLFGEGFLFFCSLFIAPRLFVHLTEHALRYFIPIDAVVKQQVEEINPTDQWNEVKTQG